MDRVPASKSDALKKLKERHGISQIETAKVCQNAANVEVQELYQQYVQANLTIRLYKRARP